jgi:hypothetical protein
VTETEKTKILNFVGKPATPETRAELTSLLMEIMMSRFEDLRTKPEPIDVAVAEDGSVTASLPLVVLVP